MVNFTSYIIPGLVVILLTISLFKRKASFDGFANGALSGLRLAVNVFPFLSAVFVCVTLFRVSGLAEYLSSLTAPIFASVGVPCELAELIMIKPFSGSGTLVELEKIYAKYGVDCYISRCASVVLGSSETVFYISAVYFSKCEVKNLSYVIPLALAITYLGAIFSCFICRYV